MMVFVSFLLTLHMVSPASFQDSAWNVYTNERHGYEIRYPAEFQLWPTGEEGKRDGGAIRIALREHAAAAPALDIFVREDASAVSRLPEGSIRDIDVDARDIDVAGTRLREATLRWKNGEIAFVQLSNADVVFLFHANAGVKDVHDTVWWKIIESFRFRER